MPVAIPLVVDNNLLDAHMGILKISSLLDTLQYARRKEAEIVVYQR